MSGGRNMRAVQRAVSWSRYIIVVDVVGLFLAFVALMVSSVWHTIVII